MNKDNDALYFSRAAIPFIRDEKSKALYYKHIGIYAYRKEALQEFTHLPVSSLEEVEKLEQLRYLENGYKLRLAVTEIGSIGDRYRGRFGSCKRKIQLRVYEMLKLLSLIMIINCL